ncbi:hypothetical protein DCAR_0830575 [Daucus carota subsp. sativus]|uniref:PRA1 family protein n=1 Tax=Daucus carota subsp. sativus TaxID=79200 RepID=A0A175YK41_DAUCS|nr:PREDICTED: PRA1 family protein F3-like [Daucus carota subsp. sativus]WOH11096.1 hypothetical protein DCAR_0830575 [Daucus carota subsp. sativus]
MSNHDTIPMLSPVDTITEFTPVSTKRRPWKEMARSFDLPGFRNTTKRVKANVKYFRVNYAAIMYLIQFFFLLSHPISLMVFVAFMMVWVYVYLIRDEPPVAFRGDLMYFWMIVVNVVFWTDDVFWNIMLALWTGGVVVWIHAAVAKTEDLFVDEQVSES